MASWDEARADFYTRWKAWWLERHPEEIGEYSWSYLFERGKQIRPRLFCELWHYLCPDRLPSIEFAFMLECAHVITLLLDDLPWMDNATERRGWPTLHCRFSLRKALLLAYDVAELAWEVSQSVPRWGKEQMKWAKWVREKARQLWLGQWLDLSRSGSRYEWTAWKTGTLFEAVAEGVAIEVGLDAEYWRGWGRALGVLFQWVDDWEDLEEDVRMGQRNAFHEAREETLKAYTELWTAVVQGIGPSWWERPFGRYLWEYFSRVDTHRVDPIPFLTSCTILPVWQEPSMDLSTRFEPGTSSSLSFLLLFEPYLYGPLPGGLDKDNTLIHAWDYPEYEWMGLLERIPMLQPLLPVLRRVDQMITAITSKGTTESDE
jgi:hypothetical protein